MLLPTPPYPTHPICNIASNPCAIAIEPSRSYTRCWLGYLLTQTCDMDSCWPTRFSCWLGVADSVNACQQVLDRVFVVSLLVHLTHVSDSTYWKPEKDCHYSSLIILIRFWHLCLSGVWIIGQHVAQSSWWQPVEPSLPSKVHANCSEGLVSFGFQKSSPHALQKGCRQLGLGPMGKGDQKFSQKMGDWSTLFEKNSGNKNQGE